MARLQKYVEQNRYNVRAKVGNYKSVRRDDGITEPKFVEEFEIYLALYYTRNWEQNNDFGSDQSEELHFANQRIGKVKKNMLIQLPTDDLDDPAYEPWIVLEVNGATTPFDPRAYDIITLVKSNGVEHTYRSAGR